MGGDEQRDLFKSNLAICMKRQVNNSCVVPAMTYGAETWTLTKQALNKLAAAHTEMERRILKWLLVNVFSPVNLRCYVLLVWRYFRSSVMINIWRYCLSAAMITRWHYCIDAVMITRWRYCLNAVMVTRWPYCMI